MGQEPGLVWHPLTAQQADFWHEYCACPSHDQGTVLHVLHLTGAGDDAALAQAIAQVLTECDVLAMRLAQPARGGMPLQATDPCRRPVLQRLDLRDAPDPSAAAQAWITAALDQPYDLMNDPLSAHALIRVVDDGWIWAARGHHISLDAYAMALIEQRAARLYGAATTGADPGLPLRPLADYLAEEARYLLSPAAAVDRAAWLAERHQAPPLVTVPRGSGAAAPLLCHRIPLPAPLAAALVDRAAALAAGWPDLLTLAAAAVLIGHPATPAVNRQVPGQLTLWRAEMGRLGSVAAAVPALVVNLLPLTLTRPSGQGLHDFLHGGLIALRQQRRHARWRFERLVDDLGIAATARPFISPLINVIPFAAPDFPGLRLDHQVMAAGPADGLTLTFHGRPNGTDLTLTIEADPSLTTSCDLDRLIPDLLDGLAVAAAVEYPD